jgi:hypothetical protein
VSIFLNPASSSAAATAGVISAILLCPSSTCVRKGKTHSHHFRPITCFQLAKTSILCGFAPGAVSVIAKVCVLVIKGSTPENAAAEVISSDTTPSLILTAGLHVLDLPAALPMVVRFAVTRLIMIFNHVLPAKQRKKTAKLTVTRER